jgi:hypothetical protein
MPESKWIDDGRMRNGAEITDAQVAFENWLSAQEYRTAEDTCTYDSEDGVYVGAKYPEDMVEMFLGANPHMEEFEEEILSHAEDIGPVGKERMREYDGPFPGDPDFLKIYPIFEEPCVDADGVVIKRLLE